MSMSQPAPERLSLEEASTAALVREALEEAKELVRLEIEMAKNEVEMELAWAKRAAIGFAVATVASVVTLSLLAMALVLALGGSAFAALVLAGVLFVVGGVAGIVRYSLLPKTPLARSRHRLEREVSQLKEHVA